MDAEGSQKTLLSFKELFRGREGFGIMGTLTRGKEYKKTMGALHLDIPLGYLSSKTNMAGLDQKSRGWTWVCAVP